MFCVWMKVAGGKGRLNILIEQLCIFLLEATTVFIVNPEKLPPLSASFFILFP